MKIAVGVRHFRPQGGAEGVVRHLVAHLHAKGHDVTVYALTGSPMPGVHLVLLRKPWFCLRCRRDWFTGKLLSDALASSGADVTFGEQKVWNANVVRPGGGVEQVYWTYHLRRKWKSSRLADLVAPFCPKRLYDLRAERSALLGDALRSIIVNSDMVRRDMMASYPEIADKIQVVHNGAEQALIGPEETARLRADMHRRLGLKAKARLALFIGHDFYRKGLDSAILSVAMAMKKRPDLDWHLAVTGRGNIDHYQFIAQRAGISDRLHYLGDMKDAFQAYAAADVMVLPTHYDPFANVTAESLCYGVPVITTAENGGCEVIMDGLNGWVVPTPDAIERMSDCLVKLACPDLLARMKAAALESSKDCRRLSTMESIERILEEAARVKQNRIHLATDPVGEPVAASAVAR